MADSLKTTFEVTWSVVQNKTWYAETPNGTQSIRINESNVYELLGTSTQSGTISVAQTAANFWVETYENYPKENGGFYTDRGFNRPGGGANMADGVVGNIFYTNISSTHATKCIFTGKVDPNYQFSDLTYKTIGEVQLITQYRMIYKYTKVIPMESQVHLVTGGPTGLTVYQRAEVKLGYVYKKDDLVYTVTKIEPVYVSGDKVVAGPTSTTPIAKQGTMAWKIYQPRTTFSESQDGSTKSHKINDATTAKSVGTTSTTGSAGLNGMRSSYFIMQKQLFLKSSGGFYQQGELSASGDIAKPGEIGYMGIGGGQLAKIKVGYQVSPHTLEYAYTVLGLVQLVENTKTIWEHSSNELIRNEVHPVGQGPEGYTGQPDALTRFTKVGDRYSHNGIYYEITAVNVVDAPIVPTPPVIPPLVSGSPPIIESKDLKDGAYVKLSITLQKQELCSQITLSLFTKYPIDIVSIYYEEDTDTWHEPKELTQHAKETQSAGVIRVTFPNIIAKRFTFIINQKNYEKNVYSVSKRTFDEKNLWDKIAIKEAEATLDLGDGLESVAQGDLDSLSGWNIYVDALQKHRLEVQSWEKEMDAYNKEYADYLVKLSNY